MLREELSHVPRGDFSQNELRMVYNIERRHDLGRNPVAPRDGSLKAAIASVESRHPRFRPTYDTGFFRI